MPQMSPCATYCCHAFGGLYGFSPESSSGEMSLANWFSESFGDSRLGRMSHSQPYSITKLSATQTAEIGAASIGPNIRPASLVILSLTAWAGTVNSAPLTRPSPFRSYSNSSCLYPSNMTRIETACRTQQRIQAKTKSGVGRLRRVARRLPNHVISGMQSHIHSTII